MDFDTLTAKIVHEMLHAYQNASGETQWADERAALVKYRYEAANVSAHLEEAAAMEKSLSEYAPEAFSRLLALRRARADRFPCAYDYESRIEQIEGSARFVELAALAQLNTEKAALYGVPYEAESKDCRIYTNTYSARDGRKMNSGCGNKNIIMLEEQNV